MVKKAAREARSLSRLVAVAVLATACGEIQAAPQTELRRTHLATGCLLGQLDLSCLLAAALAIVFQNERNLVTFVERPDARSFERRGVYENVLGPVRRRDETETLCAVEELDRATNSHAENLSAAWKKAGQ